MVISQLDTIAIVYRLIVRINGILDLILVSLPRITRMVEVLLEVEVEPMLGT